jgi:hypothetical protein
MSSLRRNHFSGSTLGAAAPSRPDLQPHFFLNSQHPTIGSNPLIIHATPHHRSFPRNRRSAIRLISPGNRFTLSFPRFRGSVRSQHNSRRPSAFSRMRTGIRNPSSAASRNADTGQDRPHDNRDPRNSLCTQRPVWLFGPATTKIQLEEIRSLRATYRLLEQFKAICSPIPAMPCQHDVLRAKLKRNWLPERSPVAEFPRIWQTERSATDLRQPRIKALTTFPGKEPLHPASVLPVSSVVKNSH